jgi:N-acetylneuraminate synthase
MDPKAMSELIAGSRAIALARGGSKGPLAEEQVTMDFAFASLVAIHELNPGDVLTVDNLWARRPGTGDFSAAEDYDRLLGRRILRHVKAGAQLCRADVAGEQ